MKIARVATVPFFLYNHLRDQIAASAAAGHEVVLISSGGAETDWLRAIPGIRFYEIHIPRKISPLLDLLALWRLFIFFARERFDIVHSTTPKAGALCALASFFARVPVRLHTFTGQPWVEMQGAIRKIAKAGDRLTALLNTRCYADSFSQRDFIVAQGICHPGKISVLGNGSLAGVNLTRFDRVKWAASRQAILTTLGIPAGCKVITFIGRLTKDKGLAELVAAVGSLRREGARCILLLVGPAETSDGSLSSSGLASDDPDIRFIGYSSEPERYLAVTDVFCLPSYREGFGNVVIEAAAMAVPSVGTDIVGLRDAIEDGATGLLVPPKDALALARALRALLADEARCTAMGEQARNRAVSRFDAQKVNAAILEEHERLVQACRRGRPPSA